MVAVIDGSTSKGSYNWEQPQGIIARTIIGEKIKELACSSVENVDVQADQFLKKLSQALDDGTWKRTGRHAYEIEPCNRLTATAVIYNYIRREIWEIGDCPFMVDSQRFSNPQPHEKELGRKRVQAIREALKTTSVQALLKDDVGRRAILDDLKRECNNQNKAFAVLDGTPVFMQGVRIKPVRQGKAHEIILASDGYPVLFPTLQETERYLETCLNRDPLCIELETTKGKYTGYSSYDDRSYIRIRLTPQV